MPIENIGFNHEVSGELASLIPEDVREDPERREDWVNRSLEIGLKAMIQGSGSVDLSFVNKEFESWKETIDQGLEDWLTDPNGTFQQAFNLSDPNSLLSKFMTAQNTDRTTHETAMTTLVNEIKDLISKDAAPKQAKIMGDEFEDEIERFLNHSGAKVMDDDIAVVGEEEVEGSAGAKKGDILIKVEEPRAKNLRIAIEAKAGLSSGAYTIDGEDGLWRQISQSMKLRGAQAGIGVVDINNGNKKHDPWMTKGRDRIIVAVDREKGDFTLLKIAYHFLRWRIVQSQIEKTGAVSKTLDFARFDELLTSISDRLKIVPKMNKNIDRATKINNGQKQDAQNLQSGIASDVAKLLGLLKSAQEEE